MNSGANDTAKPDPDCRQCRHYHRTWQPLLPHGCRCHGFRSRLWPALEVRLADGAPCLAFEVAQPPAARPGGQARRGSLYDREC